MKNIEQTSSRIVQEFLEQETDRVFQRVSKQERIKVPHPDDQTTTIVEALQAIMISDCDKTIFLQLLPTLTVEEIGNRAANLVIAPLKRIDPTNSFGGVWNEISATTAAKRLGISAEKLSKKINSRSPIGQKLRDSQASISAQSESLLKRNLLAKMPDTLKFIITSEAWLNRLIQETRTDIKRLAPDTSKEEVGEIISDTLTAVIKIVDFAKGQKTDLTKLRQTIVEGRLGQEVNLVCIHCMAFVNSQSEGIVVSGTAEDILMEDERGKKFLVSQRDRLDSFNNFAIILRNANIAHRVKLLVIDDDKLVAAGQESNVAAFLESLTAVVNRHPLSEHNLEIVPGSNLINRQDFLVEWQRRSDSSNTVAERLVDAEFEKLKQKPLPDNWKTRAKAREVAQKSFLNQFALGATVPQVFDPAIILQRSNAHQQSTEMFNLGSRGKGKSPLIFSFWKDRKLI